jgi:DNA polymerase V
MNKTTENLIFFKPAEEKTHHIPLANTGVSAGFPSPADDFKELRISIDQEVVKNEEATFYARVAGQSMQGAGLDDGDLLVIDRSKEPLDNAIAVEAECVYLMAENPNYSPIKVTEDNELIIWGVVTYVVKKV